jgi:hypothetical protein
MGKRGKGFFVRDKVPVPVDLLFIKKEKSFQKEAELINMYMAAFAVTTIKKF